jgi:hypothetical protein
MIYCLILPKKCNELDIENFQQLLELRLRDIATIGNPFAK